MNKENFEDVIHVLCCLISICLASIFITGLLGVIGYSQFGDIACGLFVIFGLIISYFLGRYIFKSMEESMEQMDKIREQQKVAEHESHIWYRNSLKEKAVKLSNEYPLATKYYFRLHWGIHKDHIYSSDITDDKVDTLLNHSFEYCLEEYKQKEAIKIKEQEARKEEERLATLKRLEKEKRYKKQIEINSLPISLPNCVSSWNNRPGSSLKISTLYKYYPYSIYKDSASPNMRETWKLVWNFKNDPNKYISRTEHIHAVGIVVDYVVKTLSNTFGTKTEYLTFVCIPASTQEKNKLRYEEFSKLVCNKLNMTNAFPHINIVEGGQAKHEGGDGNYKVTYNKDFFKDKYIVLFDDVRTTGKSLELEKSILESYGSKVICAIAIAQTVH